MRRRRREDPVVPLRVPEAPPLHLALGFFFVSVHLNSLELFIDIRSIVIRQQSALYTFS